MLPTILAPNQDISLSHVIFSFLKPWMKIERQSSPSTWLVVVCGFIPSGISGKSLDPVEMQSHLQQRRSPSCRQTARARPSPRSPPPATRSPRSRCSAPAGSVTTARAAHRGRARLRAVVHLEEHAAALPIKQSKMFNAHTTNKPDTNLGDTICNSGRRFATKSFHCTYHITTSYLFLEHQ